MIWGDPGGQLDLAAASQARAEWGGQGVSPRKKKPYLCDRLPCFKRFILLEKSLGIH